MDRLEKIKETLREICEADPSEHFELVLKAQDQIEDLRNYLMKNVLKATHATTKLYDEMPDWVFDSDEAKEVQDA